MESIKLTAKEKREKRKRESISKIFKRFRECICNKNSYITKSFYGFIFNFFVK